MSLTNAVQTAIYQRLMGSAEIAAFVGDRVYDRPPSDGTEAPYITIGAPETITDDAECINGIEYSFQIDCWSEYQGGKKEVNGMNDAVRRLFHYADMTVSTGAIVQVRVANVLVLDDPDGITKHGIVRLEIAAEDE